MTRTMDATLAAYWPDAWIIEERIRREREEREERRERAWLELPFGDPESDRAPEGESPAGGTVVVIDL